MTRQPREELVLNLLQTGWDDSNTFGLTPSITYGWFDEDATNAQLTVGQPEESPVNGGQTGFSGITPDGSGPSQEFDGVVLCHAWTRNADLDAVPDSQSFGRHPRGYNAYVAEEVRRVIGNHESRPTDPRTGNEPVQYLSFGGSRPADEPDSGRTKPVWHLVIAVGYGYGPA